MSSARSIVAVPRRGRRDRERGRAFGRRRLGRRPSGHAAPGRRRRRDCVRAPRRTALPDRRLRCRRGPRCPARPRARDSAPPSAVRSWSAVGSGGRSAPRVTKPRRSRPRPRRASRSSPTSWPPPSPTQTLARRWSGSRRSRPHCDGSPCCVAEGAAPAAVFDAVAAEMEGLLGADGVTLSRYEPDEEITIVAHRGLNAALLPPGTRMQPQGRERDRRRCDVRSALRGWSTARGRTTRLPSSTAGWRCA